MVPVLRTLKTECEIYILQGAGILFLKASKA